MEGKGKKKKKKTPLLHSNTQGSCSHHTYFSQKSLSMLPSLVAGMQRALLILREDPLGRIYGVLQGDSRVSQDRVITPLTQSLCGHWETEPSLPKGARSARVFSFPLRRNTSPVNLCPSAKTLPRSTEQTRWLQLLGGRRGAPRGLCGR